MPPPGIADLKSLARHLAKNGPVKTLETSRRIRLLYKGHYLADTTNALFVWEHPYYPQYYIPSSSLCKSSLTITDGDAIKNDSNHTIATTLTVTSSGGSSTNKLFRFADDLPAHAAQLSGLVKVDFGVMDQWLEEDTPIFVHPKDPFKRVDIALSTRGIRVAIDGHKVAEASTAMHLYETSLPVRYYIPLTAIDAAVLRPSETRTQCPYKGEAEYYDVCVGGKTYKDIVWFYSRPTMECAGVAGLCCFYNEKVEIELQAPDGTWEKLEKAKSPFS